MVTAPVSDTEGGETLSAVAGVITPPDDVVAKSFHGVVQNFAPTVADNDVWRATITIRGTGPVTTHRP